MFKNRKTIKIIISTIALATMLPVGAVQAAFKSASYIIYENIHHTFDGPVISNVSGSLSGTTVVYDTASDFSSSKEQGSPTKDATSHSVDVTGLAYSTTYYYKVKSTRINGGVTTDTTVNTVTTGAAPADEECEECPAGGGGGGMIIIDKTDNTPPVILNIAMQTVDSNSIKVTWDTDEIATSFLEYGRTANYGAAYGHWTFTLEHEVILTNLLPNTEYHTRILTTDDWGNTSFSGDLVFNTTEGLISEIEEPIGEVEPEEPEPKEPTAEISQRLLDMINNLFPDLDDITSIEDLSDLIEIPILSGAPLMDIGATEATIYWETDRRTNSLVAISPEDRYQEGAEEPYLQIVGDAENYITDHEVTVYNLTPNTVYHFQLRSKPRLGGTIKSRDFTFRTTLEELKITSFFTQIIDDQTAVFKWVTNKNADSAVRFTPYRGDNVAVDQAKTVRDDTMSVIHEIEISDFEGGVYYDVELVSADEKGNYAIETILRFSTSAEDNPPIISHIKTDSTVFVDRSDKIQTVISWLTNESATSQVYYQEGVHGSNVTLKEKTVLNINYTKEHVIVISKFNPGKVYTFRVESTDSSGNTSLSPPHTFMTAKKKESIFQIIMNILENTFGWLKKIYQ
jgi:uncharacterized protein YdeI (BOF family)